MDGFYYTSEKVIKGFPFEMPSVTSGVGVKLFNAMVQHNDKVAQIYVETGESLKYGELLKRCIRTAIEMKNRSVSPTDIVLMIVDSSSTDFCVPFIASLFLSATASYLPEDVTLDDIVHVLRLLQPTMLFTSLTFLDIVENAVKLVKIQSTIVVLGSTTKHVPFELFVQMKSNEACFTPTEPDDIKDTAYICFTSGSTGMMKAACISDYRMSVLSQHFINGGVISPVFMYHACLFWDIDGVLLIGSILSGYTSVFVKGFQNHSNMLWTIIEKYKVTTIFGSPIEIHTLFNSDCQRQLNITSLSTIISVGSSLSRSTILRFKSILPLIDLIQMYGQTELATVTLFRPGNAEDKALANLKPESCGRPAMGVQIKVVDSDGSALGFNQIGEFRVRTPLIMNGYYNSDVDLSHLLDPDGWFKTGDLGYYDEDFCFFITGRIKDLIKCGDIHISPLEVEKIILQHPAVEAAAVFGIPNEIYGDLVTALVVRKDKCNAGAEEIEEFVNSKVSDRRRLRGGVYFVDKLEYSTNGKLQRTLMKTQFLNQLKNS